MAIASLIVRACLHPDQIYLENNCIQTSRIAIAIVLDVGLPCALLIIGILGLIGILPQCVILYGGFVGAGIWLFGIECLHVYTRCHSNPRRLSLNQNPHVKAATVKRKHKTAWML